MRRVFAVMGVLVVMFACSEQAGQMLVDGGQMIMDAGDAMVPDAGAQQGESFNFDCDGAGFVLTDIDFEYGKTIDHSKANISGFGLVDFVRYSSLSIDGKVLAACNAADTVRVEVLP